jgi:cell division protein FtsB
MAENLGIKIEVILKKLEKLDVIELQLNEVHAKVANIEETVSRLDSEVQVLKTRTTKLEKNVEELEEGFQYNEEDVRDLQRANTRLEHEVYDLKKQLMYMETYSRRENLKLFGVPENAESTSNDMDEGSQQRVTPENTKEVNYWKRN